MSEPIMMWTNEKCPNCDGRGTESDSAGCAPSECWQCKGWREITVSVPVEVPPPKPVEPFEYVFPHESAEAPQEIEGWGISPLQKRVAQRETKTTPQVEQSFEQWWKSTYEKELKRQGVGGLARIIHMNGAREGWNAAKAEGK